MKNLNDFKEYLLLSTYRLSLREIEERGEKEEKDEFMI